MISYAWLQYGRITNLVNLVVEHSVTGTNFCAGTYLIAPIVRHLLTVMSIEAGV